MARIQVLDSNNKRPKDNAHVIVSWVSGGTSSGRTDSNGYVEVGSSGTANYISVDGKYFDGQWIEGTVPVYV